ncbi:unnamed protein product [Protopolystoma xenopodis]|uniref:Uncharacterized protein n=1 Tax=Protopolystoma xenopodis TaxID=117903 RepID=A0A448X1Y0_9PLAT|nr:unnamed protein product [Protopolystoma xenopodis]
MNRRSVADCSLEDPDSSEPGAVNDASSITNDNNPGVYETLELGSDISRPASSTILSCSLTTNTLPLTGSDSQLLNSTVSKSPVPPESNVPTAPEFGPSMSNRLRRRVCRNCAGDLVPPGESAQSGVSSYLCYCILFRFYL